MPTLEIIMTASSNVTSTASTPRPATRAGEGPAKSRSERTYHPDPTARPIPSGADPMDYKRPHPASKPVRDDQSADPPHGNQIRHVSDDAWD
jgi:hypothetical protein